MPDCAAADVVFTNVMHRNCRHDADIGIDTFERVLQSQGVHYRGQHAHMVAGDTVDSGFSEAGAAENVAAANDDGNFDPELGNITDFYGDPVNDDRVNAVVFLAQQRFAAEFQKDSS